VPAGDGQQTIGTQGAPIDRELSHDPLQQVRPVGLQVVEQHLAQVALAGAMPQ